MKKNLLLIKNSKDFNIPNNMRSHFKLNKSSISESWAVRGSTGDVTNLIAIDKGGSSIINPSLVQ
jgi:putative heme degradation protein